LTLIIPTDKMSNHRIAVNTAATYTRSVVTVGLALFSTRWVLNALGQTDYGLFSVVGSIILFITFLNGVMANSAARYFAYYIGQNDLVEINRWFNSAFSIHLCLAFILVLIGWPVGEFFIGHVLMVPDNRLTTCLWIFRISLISAFASMVSVPFVAMFTAKQNIAELALWGILQSFLVFTLACFLRFFTTDKLLCYAAGMVSIVFFVQATQVYRAITVFDECSIDYEHMFDCHRLKSIFSFAAWNLIGSSGGLFRDQGCAILLNLYFGPSVNAAYGIANQVSNQANQLSASMIGAFSPEITSSEGRGDRARMLSLSQRASKFGTILVLLLAIPLITEMDYLLSLWLGVPPPNTGLFCQLILCTFLIERLCIGHVLAVQAHGRIAAYQVTVGTSLLLTLPLAWLFLKLGLAPTSIGIAFIITMSVTSLGRILWGRHLLGMTIRCWMKAVVWPSAIVALVALIAAMVPRWLLPPSFFRFVLVCGSSVVLSMLTMWFLAFDCKERDYFRQNARRLFLKNDREPI